jgi:tRNA pseudouridine38-40 synthase
MRILKLTVAYDGTRFVGWQRQAEGESIQGLLEDALARFEGAPVTVHGAGRTDAGVHALGQVASASVTFTHPVDTVARALNAQLPQDIRILDVAEAKGDFHARFSARSKTYRFHIRTGAAGDPFTRAFVWQLAESLDISAMRTAAAALVGTHDFAVFQSAGTPVATTVRTIFRSELRGPEASAPLRENTVPLPENAAPRSENGGCLPISGADLSGPRQFLFYEVTADGFLRHMVRTIVGTLVEIGRGWRSAASMAQLIEGGTRAHAGATAPPHGLFLVGVDYD